MGRNRGLITYRRSQSNLPRTHREQSGKESRRESRKGMQFRAAQHAADVGVIKPHPARGRPPIVELEERGRTYGRELLTCLAVLTVVALLLAAG